MKKSRFSTSQILEILKQADVFKAAVLKSSEAISALLGVKASSRGQGYEYMSGLCYFSDLQDLLSPLGP